MKNHFVKIRKPNLTINNPIESVIYDVGDEQKLLTFEDIVKLVNDSLIKNGEHTINSKSLTAILADMVKRGLFKEINGQRLFLWLKTIC